MRKRDNINNLAIIFKESKSEKDFTTLYKASLTYYRLFVYKNYTRDAELVEDLINQTYAKVWEKIDQFDTEKSSFITWSTTILKNFFLKHVIKQQRLLETSSDEEYVVTELSHDVNEITKHESLDLTKYLSYLKEPMKTYFIRRYIDGERLRDIATSENMNPDTMKSFIHRGKRRIRMMLEKQKRIDLNLVRCKR